MYGRRRLDERRQVSRRNEKAVLARPVDYFGDPPAGRLTTGRPHAIACGRTSGRRLVALGREEERIGRGQE